MAPNLVIAPSKILKILELIVGVRSFQDAVDEKKHIEILEQVSAEVLDGILEIVAHQQEKNTITEYHAALDRFNNRFPVEGLKKEVREMGWLIQAALKDLDKANVKKAKERIDELGQIIGKKRKVDEVSSDAEGNGAAGGK